MNLMRRHTQQDREKLAAVAVEALRAKLARVPAVDHEVELAAEWERGRVATKAVSAAIRAGVSHREIASAAGLPGLLVIDCIDSGDLRGDALRVERHAAERYVRTVREASARWAQSAHGEGQEKQQIAEALGISRPTLNDWLKGAAA